MIIILIQTPGLFAEEENKTHRGYVVGSRSSSEPLSPWPRGSSEWAGGGPAFLLPACYLPEVRVFLHFPKPFGNNASPLKEEQSCLTRTTYFCFSPRQVFVLTQCDLLYSESFHGTV